MCELRILLGYKFVNPTDWVWTRELAGGRVTL